jgi:chaperonin GroES
MTTTKKIKITPTSGYVLIEPSQASKKTESGIYLPETSDEKPQEGIVLAVGPDEITETGTKRKSPVKVGEKVIYKKWGGSEVKVGTKEYLFAKFEDILAIIK